MAELTNRARAKARRMRHIKARRNWQMYMFLIIPVAWLIVFKYVPMWGIQIAFKQYSLRFGIWGSPWVGLKQFFKFFNSYQFWRVVPNTIKLSLYGMLTGFPGPIMLALMLNALRSNRYRSLIQNVTYLPHFISTVVMVGMIMQVFNVRTGLYGQLYQMFTGANMAPDLLGKAAAFPHIYVWSGHWQSWGWGTIIYTAALTNVDPELHEAAVIDGASRWKRLIYIDFYALIPMITIKLILSMTGFMGIGFDKVYLMQTSLNLSASEVISTYVYKVGIAASNSDFSYGTAIGLFNAVVNITLMVVANAIARAVGENSLF